MTIKRQSFTLQALPPQPDPGEQVFAPVSSGSPTTPQSFSFVVPANVYELSAVLVSVKTGSTPYQTTIKRGATTLLSTADSIGGSVGGGNGGAKGAWAGGGAAGYAGNGGTGATTSTTNGGNAPSGGGGGGGAYGSSAGGSAGYGGGVGLQGQGSSGIGGTYGVATPGNWGKTGSVPSSGLTPGGSNGSSDGGDLRWKNSIAVTPGETLTISFATGFYPGYLGTSYFPAARLMWGGGRSYPSNAPDTIPQGQITLTAANTTWTVPAGVTSVCACAQQANGSSAAVTLVVSGSTVLKAQNGARVGDGGGDGGATNPTDGGGGGGGGGYSADGGASNHNGSGGSGAGGLAGYYTENPSGPVFGGSGSTPTYTYTPPTPGGGVGIAGTGASGTTSGSLFGSPDPIDGYTGGGAASQDGGALAYKNSITVTPGQVLTVNAAGGRIRIIWGPSRSYPSNALAV